MKKCVLTFFFLIFTTPLLLAQLTAYSIRAGGNGSLICNDSLMLFIGKALYVKTPADQMWSKSDSTFNYNANYALSGARIYRKSFTITPHGNSTTYNVYTNEISISNDFGNTWQTIIPKSKLGNRFFYNTFFVKDSSIFLYSNDSVYKYSLITDTLLPIITGPVGSIRVHAPSLILKNNVLLFSFYNCIYKIDSINAIDTIAVLPDSTYIYSFDVGGGKIAAATTQGNYFSNDGGITWIRDNYLTADTILNYNHNFIAIHNNDFFSITNDYVVSGGLNINKSVISFSSDGINWQRDSLFFNAWIHHFSTVSAIGFSRNAIYISTVKGVFEYNTLQHTFTPINEGIKENSVIQLATNKSYHLILDKISLTLKNTITGAELEIDSFLPPLADVNFYNYYNQYYFSITENNKIYFGVMDYPNEHSMKKLFVSQDLGHSWVLVNNYVIDYFASNDSLFYITDNKCYRSFNGGLTSTQMSYSVSPISFASEYKSDYSIQGKSNKIYLVSYNYSLHDYFYETAYSIDFGVTWQFLSLSNNPRISIDNSREFAFAGGNYFTRNAGSSLWNRLPSLQNSLKLYRSSGGGVTDIFTKNNSLFTFEKGSYAPYGTEKDVLYIADNAYNFFYPVFQSSLFYRLNVKFHQENNIVSFIPQVNSSYYYVYNDTVGSSIGLASGRVLFDANHNNILDSLDKPLSEIIITNGVNSAVSDNNGNYFIPLSQNNDTLTAHTGQNYASVFPTSVIAHPNDTGIVFLVKQLVVSDLSVHATLSSSPRPGFNHSVLLTVKNEGSTSQPCTIKLVKDHFTNFKSSIPYPTSIIGDTLTWNQDTIIPSNYFSINVIESVAINDTLGREIHYKASVFPALADTSPANNVFIINAPIVGSYDPNDKQVEPKVFTGENLTEGDFLTYTIRFQNSGTANAYYVRIEDTLSSLLDITTLQTITSSHPYNMSFKDGNVISYWFPSIYLPYSSSNELQSHGFVTFKIKPKSNWTRYKSINNSAQIYFDYNNPVTTNIVSSLLTFPTGITLNENVCDSFLLNGISYRHTGIFRQILANVAGFDSIITLNLVINRSEKTMYQTSCKSFVLNNITYNSSGVYTQMLTNYLGCDSTVVLYLTINNSTFANVAKTACESFTFNNQSYDSSGVYIQQLTNAAGCDSIVTLHLSIHKNSNSTVTKTACDSLSIGNQTYTTSGIYYPIISNTAGCDSLITFHLNLLHGTNITTTKLACNNYFFNGFTYTSSGNYTVPFTNASGCASVVHLSLTVNSIDTSVTQNGLTLIANDSTANYQWIDCNNANAAIAAQINQSYTATANGNYAVVLTKNMCSDTSECYNIMSVGLAKNYNADEMSLFPNPTTSKLYIQSNKKYGKIIISNATGAIVKTERVSFQKGIDISDFAPGIYFIEIISSETTDRAKFIKQ